MKKEKQSWVVCYWGAPSPCSLRLGGNPEPWPARRGSVALWSWKTDSSGGQGPAVAAPAGAVCAGLGIHSAAVTAPAASGHSPGRSPPLLLQKAWPSCSRFLQFLYFLKADGSFPWLCLHCHHPSTDNSLISLYFTM